MRGLAHGRVWVALLVAAGLVALFGWWCNTRVRRTVETQLAAALTTTLDANVTALDIWITNQIKLVSALGANSEIHTLAVQTLERAEGMAGTSARAVEIPEADQLDALLRPILDSIGYGIAHLVSTNFTVVGGSARGRPRPRLAVHDDHVAKFAELFASGQPVVITPFKPQFRRRPGSGPPPDGPRRWNADTRPPPGGTSPPPQLSGTTPGQAGPLTPGRPPQFNRFRRGEFTLMQVAVPVRDDKGAVRGALALILDPDREFTRILSVARWGKSGETYAFDQRGLLISRSRFDDQLKRLGLIEDRPETSSALNLRLSDPGVILPERIEPEDASNPKRPLIPLIASAVAGESGLTLAASRDYRGVPVVGAWRWLPGHDFGVATQIDATEAYQPLRVLNLLFLIVFLVLLLCAVGLLLVSQASVIWRQRLGEAELKLRQLGQYTLEEKIGEGGMGVVYRARHGLLRRDTALKLLLPDRADPAAVGRFEREVHLTCRLTHPNTIQVYDYGRTPDGIFYYAMEFLRGLNLHELVHRFGPQPESRVIHILVQVCGALAEAHALGLVHRDIKPGNVFLCRRGGLPDCVKVLDFGLVRDFRAEPPEGTGPHPIVTGAIEGTPSFMPPEAILDPSQCDPRSDLYSLGALGCFVVTGRNVFDADDVTSLHDKHLHELPAPPSRRTDNPISPEFESLLLQCLAKDANDRPQSVEELRSRLMQCARAADWNSTVRAAWWRDRPELEDPRGSATSGPQVAVPEATIRIDLSAREDARDRTPARR